MFSYIYCYLALKRQLSIGTQTVADTWVSATICNGICHAVTIY
ncbi:hypothetical protein [Bacteroides xylanisolvens]|nr:hypothetical protein [Bacteroides xylanisolvens]